MRLYLQSYTSKITVSLPFLFCYQNETAELDIILSDEAQRDNKDGAAMNAAYDAGDEDVQKAGVSSSQDLSGDDATVDLEEEDAEPEEDPWNAAFKTKTKIITPWNGKHSSIQLLHCTVYISWLYCKGAVVCFCQVNFDSFFIKYVTLN